LTIRIVTNRLLVRSVHEERLNETPEVIVSTYKTSVANCGQCL